jgi:hypothetical protein
VTALDAPTGPGTHRRGHRAAARGYRSGDLASTMFLAGSGDRHTNWEGRMFALALLKGYPNTTIIIFYVLASAIFVLAMYWYHRSQM